MTSAYLQRRLRRENEVRHAAMSAAWVNYQNFNEQRHNSQHQHAAFVWMEGLDGRNQGIIERRLYSQAKQWLCETNMARDAYERSRHRLLTGKDEG